MKRATDRSGANPKRGGANQRQHGHTSDGPSLRRRCLRALRRLLAALGLAIALYGLTVLIGLIPVNNDFEPTPGGVEIFLSSTSIHADIVMPVATQGIDWRQQFSADHFVGDTSGATYVAVGWGDKQFFTKTPTWAEIHLVTAARAVFWPTPSCLHVRFSDSDTFVEGLRSVTISPSQYLRLVEFIKASFRRQANGTTIRIANAAYDVNDAFFEARGSFHGFNTCNTWVGRAMRAAGIRTGWLTPLPKSVFTYLPD